MIVEFLGMKDVPKKSGCSACGKKRTSKYNLLREKKFSLPSGKTQTFRIGEQAHVITHDGIFLLDSTYSVNGKQERMFKEVQ